jgi:hypothetical protein
MPSKQLKTPFYGFLRNEILSGNESIINEICKNSFKFSEDQIISVKFYENQIISLDAYPDASTITLNKSSDSNKYLLENSKKIYEGLKLSEFQASNQCYWAYLSLVVFREYMEDIRPLNPPDPKANLGEINSEKFINYIISHYLFRGSSVGDLLLNDISLLWWASHLTYCEDKSDPYELTAEVFTMLDYTRHLLPGTQGRDKVFRDAVLEFVCENKALFSSKKEGKIRLIQRKLNFEAGVRMFPILQKDEIKTLINGFKDEIAGYSE